ncbi:MAG: DUF488 family protein [Anaeromyxobacteraceae bacterium]
MSRVAHDPAPCTFLARLTDGAYEGPANVDGYRVLVDRLWPRGVKKEALRGPHASPRFRRRLARAPPTRAGERCPRCSPMTATLRRKKWPRRSMGSGGAALR